jgi:catechol 2,3-dioxygenase-like lactoylglutathione lyase family enzyme
VAVLGLAHVAIRARDLEASTRFYAEALGLQAGYRPPFGFPGRWLYAENGAALIHLLAADDAAARRYTGSADGGAGAVDHVAFAATDWPAMRGRLQGLGVPFQVRQTPDTGAPQVFLHDPDGVTVELNY